MRRSSLRSIRKPTAWLFWVAPGELKKFVELAEQTEADLPVEGSIVRTIPVPEGVNPVTVAGVVKQTLQVLVPPGGVRSDIHKRSAIVPDPTSRSLIVNL